MHKKLLIAADVDASLRERALDDGRFDVTQTPVRTEEELLAIIGDAQILVTRAYNKVTRCVIEAAPQLELIAQATSGIDNIDAAAARERGIRILNMPGINANAVAELVLGNMIAMTRAIPFYTRAVVRGDWPREDCATRHELRHHLLGIIGLGQVGKIVARLATAFGMHVRAYDPYITDFPNATPVQSLHELLAQSDIVTLHVPLTEETRRMVGKEEIAQMKRGAYLLNASRGEVLDQNAALTALADQQLAGLALDVFDPEPPLTIFPDDARLILTPHVGGCTHEVKSAAGAKLFEQILAHYAA
jgi:phosphoglycerate dehydrogenase-like enzyme